MGDISRDVYNAIGPDGEQVRLYKDEDTGELLPSVTSILKSRDEDLSNLYDWQDDHDGEGDNAYHGHWFWYSRNRGTLAHYHALKQMDDSLEWTGDEAESVWELSNVDQLNDPDEYPDVHDDTPREVLYSIEKYLGGVNSWGEFYDTYEPYKPNDYYSEGIVSRKDTDVAFFAEAFDRMCRKLELSSDNAIRVEHYLFDAEYGYAGQCDLLLEYPDGSVALADLKTKKGAYDKEKLQGAAYASAVQRDTNIPIDTVDRTEVWCINPDTGKYAIYTEDDSVSEYHTSQYWKKSWHDHWDEFEELLEEYTFSVPDEQ